MLASLVQSCCHLRLCVNASNLLHPTNCHPPQLCCSPLCCRHQSPSVLVPALRTVGNIVTGDDQQTQTIINCGALPCLLNLLTTSHKKSIKKVGGREVAGQGSQNTWDYLDAGAGSVPGGRRCCTCGLLQGSGLWDKGLKHGRFKRFHCSRSYEPVGMRTHTATQRHLPCRPHLPCSRTITGLASACHSQCSTATMKPHNSPASVLQEACWTISNITAGTKEQIQSVIDAGIIPPLVHLLSTAGESRAGRSWAR